MPVRAAALATLQRVLDCGMVPIVACSSIVQCLLDVVFGHTAPIDPGYGAALARCLETVLLQGTCDMALHNRMTGGASGSSVTNATTSISSAMSQQPVLSITHAFIGRHAATLQARGKLPMKVTATLDTRSRPKWQEG